MRERVLTGSNQRGLVVLSRRHGPGHGVEPYSPTAVDVIGCKGPPFGPSLCQRRSRQNREQGHAGIEHVKSEPVRGKRLRQARFLLTGSLSDGVGTRSRRNKHKPGGFRSLTSGRCKWGANCNCSCDCKDDVRNLGSPWRGCAGVRTYSTIRVSASTTASAGRAFGKAMVEMERRTTPAV